LGLEQRKYIWLIAGLLLPIFLYWGEPETIQIDPEYLNGILTASSILYGFLAVMLGREPKEYLEKFRYRYYLRGNIYYSFEILAFSIIYLSLSAAKVIPSTLPLVLLTTSFLFNAFVLIIHLHYHFESVKLGKTPQPLETKPLR
jgi:hypothetical protein